MQAMPQIRKRDLKYKAGGASDATVLIQSIAVSIDDLQKDGTSATIIFRLCSSNAHIRV